MANSQVEEDGAQGPGKGNIHSRDKVPNRGASFWSIGRARLRYYVTEIAANPPNFPGAPFRALIAAKDSPDLGQFPSRGWRSGEARRFGMFLAATSVQTGCRLGVQCICAIRLMPRGNRGQSTY